MTATSSKSSTKFYQEDIVRRSDSSDTYGIIMRCWHDAEDLPPVGPPMDPLTRPLMQGEVGILFLPSGLRDIVSESEYVLVDRTFLPGDYCKRSIDDLRSGVVTSIDVMTSLAHAINGDLVEGWKNVHELHHSCDIDAGDYVIFDDWIGQVIELFDELIVEASGSLVRLPELGSRVTVGDKGMEILPDPVNFQGVYSAHGAPLPSRDDTVVELNRTVLAICWLAVNQRLDPSAAQNKKRPERFWYGENLSKLTVIRTKSDDIRVGDKVLLNNSDENVPTTRHGHIFDPLGQVTVQTLCVKETRTTAHVLWQDGTTETLQSTELIPYLNPDEYDCWPGDHVFWKSEDQTRAAVVQSVNSTDRVAKIRFSDTGEIEMVSVLELDPNGMSDWASATTHPHIHGLGVRRGDIVFIHPESSTNSYKIPRVPRIGEIEDWVRESPVRSDGELGGWRREMADLGSRVAAERKGSVYHVQQPSQAHSSLSWVGEVTNLLLDGSVQVTHPNKKVERYSLNRLTKLYDSLEQIEDDGWDDGMSEGEDIHDHNHDHDHDHDEGIWVQDEGGIWQYTKYDDDDDDWEETDEDEAMEVDAPWEEADEAHRVVNLDTPMAPPRNVTPDMADSASILSASPPTPRTNASDFTGEDNAVYPHTDEHETSWKRFEILPSAPIDHAFHATKPGQPSRQFLTRMSKEYRAISSSLPDSIIVRAYEDRADLLRCLIIGPENTPYEDAPFVIDWMLDSNFPQSPPIAHFLSWTNGNGRVNPNLYEEGKVCLSILGTWAGDRSETWSAARSSLLQAFVSIQGLVLVKEPWFCEPAYEKLRGTEEGMVNSRLYSEKAFVLSRGFVRRALEVPLGDLTNELEWLYYTNGRLEKVLRDSRKLVEKSKLSPNVVEAEQDIAVPRLTTGGIITLERTLGKLQVLLDARHRT
ncbi:hypothetical protein BJ138DRAFT_1147026 [Hygrophoropsis aurantiaca]|uniref:Uncharacterized protein n=1 Tax=Hygrophoropsis aurantiaca TaxID=72124 RepID=A0ACB8AI34_9AGAM|nr:hypothetical protein BJ138DRAFT_1147026 [Hygrophoropsis aurantiaca]